MQGMDQQSRRERNKASKRARILNSATARFTSQGYSATLMSQVAEDADVAAGTVFQYAATKAELLVMVLLSKWPTNSAEAQALARSAPTARDAVRAFTQPLFGVLLQWPGLAIDIARELLFGAPGQHHDEALAIIEETEDAMGAELERRGYGAGALAARTLVSALVLEIHRSHSGRIPAEGAEHRLDALIDLILQGAHTS